LLLSGKELFELFCGVQIDGRGVKNQQKSLLRGCAAGSKSDF
jgi:hypothetical protein